MSKTVNDISGSTPDHGAGAVVSLARVRAKAELKASLKKMVKELARQHAWEDHLATLNDSET